MKLKLLFTILILVSLSNTRAQNLSQMEVISDAEFLSSEIIAGDVRDANNEVCAGIKIVSDLVGLAYDSYNGIVKVDQKPGEDLLFLQPSERVVVIRKTGYEPLQIILNEYGIKLESGKVWQIKITGEKQLEIIPINIISKPNADEIWIDNERGGNEVTRQVSVGSHELKISRRGYRTIIDTIVVTSTNTLFNYNLEVVRPVMFTIKSTPKEATLFLNGNEKGKTDLQLFEVEGEYSIQLQKFGYKLFESKITINHNSENNFSFNLVKNSGYLSITTEPAETEVFVNGELIREKEVELITGEYFIELHKTNYLTIYDTLDINIGERIQKNYRLERISSGISFNLFPSDAAIIINGKLYAGDDVIELNEGTYFLEIKRDGYETYLETINLIRKQNITKDIKLIPVLGSLQFTVVPIDANVKLWSNEVLVESWTGSNFLDSLLVGSYDIEVKCAGYNDQLLDIQIEQNKTAIEEVELEPKATISNVKINKIVAGTNLISNTNYDDNTGLYKIKYDLNGELAKDYRIEIYLMDNSNPAYEYKLSKLTGDIGEGRFAGRGKSFIWYCNDEFSSEIDNEYLYLKITAEEISSGIPWYVYVGAAVLGGTAAVFLSAKGSPPSGGTTINLPTPPVRP